MWLTATLFWQQFEINCSKRTFIECAKQRRRNELFCARNLLRGSFLSNMLTIVYGSMWNSFCFVLFQPKIIISQFCLIQRFFCTFYRIFVKIFPVAFFNETWKYCTNQVHAHNIRDLYRSQAARLKVKFKSILVENLYNFVFLNLFLPTIFILRVK